MKLSPDFLGRRIDRRLVRELEALGVDASGENGEVHTLVTDKRAALFQSAAGIRSRKARGR